MVFCELFSVCSTKLTVLSFTDSTALVENITFPLLVSMMEYVTVVMDLMSGRNLQSEKMCYRNITLTLNMCPVKTSVDGCFTTQ